MYTLKKSWNEKGKAVLLGPIHKRFYASHAPKRHAFAVARREADKRGFPKGCGKTVQIVTDRDEDLQRGVKDFLGVSHLFYALQGGRERVRRGAGP